MYWFRIKLMSQTYQLINEEIKEILYDIEISTDLKNKLDEILFGDLDVRKKRIKIRRLKKKDQSYFAAPFGAANVEILSLLYFVCCAFHCLYICVVIHLCGCESKIFFGVGVGL